MKRAEFLTQSDLFLFLSWIHGRLVLLMIVIAVAKHLLTLDAQLAAASWSNL
jgi:hypothetical protein